MSEEKEREETLKEVKKDKDYAQRWLTRAANTAEELSKQDLKAVSAFKYEKVVKSTMTSLLNSKNYCARKHS